MVKELPNGIHSQVLDLSAAGDAHAESGEAAEAIECYRMALLLLPRPGDQWEAYQWLQAAIGDVRFENGQYREALFAFEQALKGGGLGNPFIHLRMGQCAFHLGDEHRAVEELLRAYMADGAEVFREDQRYLKFLKSKVQL